MDMAQYARDMRRAARDLNRNLRVELGEAGSMVQETAAGLSDSRKAEASLRHRRSGYSVLITAGGAGAAVAALREVGNRGSSPTASTFRHPVFGHWYSKTPPQAKHPYLLPAFELRRTEVLDLMKRAMADSFPGSK